MNRFHYTAASPDGQQIAGVLSADSRLQALQQLSAENLMPLVVEPASATRSAGQRSVGAGRLAAMYRLLADLLESGVPLLKALDILADQTSDVRLKPVLETLRTRVSNGQPLASAMREHDGVFPEVTISLVHAGEEGGFLEESLSRAARLTERQEELRGKVIGALAYPVFLLCTGTVVVIGMIVFFVPQFAPMFDRMRSQGQLPVLTDWLLKSSDLAQQHWPWLLLLLVCGVAYARSRLQTESVRRQLDQVRLRLPVIGQIERFLTIGRFSRVLGTLLSNDVSLLRSLKIAASAAGNSVITLAVNDAAENVTTGRTLAEPLAASGQFPRELTEMISVGEQANRLDKVLLSIADKLESRAQSQLDVLVKLLEPVVMLVMAGLIGFLVIALLLPVLGGGGIG